MILVFLYLVVCWVLHHNDFLDALYFGRLFCHCFDATSCNKCRDRAAKFLGSCDGTERGILELAISLLKDGKCGLQACEKR